MERLDTLNNSIDIKNNINPSPKDVAPMSVNGIEKYPISLKVIPTFIIK